MLLWFISDHCCWPAEYGHKLVVSTAPKDMKTQKANQVSEHWIIKSHMWLQSRQCWQVELVTCRLVCLICDDKLTTGFDVVFTTWEVDACCWYRIWCAEIIWRLIRWCNMRANRRNDWNMTTTTTTTACRTCTWAWTWWAWRTAMFVSTHHRWIDDELKLAWAILTDIRLTNYLHRIITVNAHVRHRKVISSWISAALIVVIQDISINTDNAFCPVIRIDRWPTWLSWSAQSIAHELPCRDGKAKQQS